MIFFAFENDKICDLECNKKLMKRFNLPFKKQEKQAIIFIGIQASGKTTFYNRMLSDGHYVHISLDELHTRNKENIALAECFERNKSFVIDNTNPNISDRERYINMAKEYGYHVIGIFFQSKIRDCIRRNEGRGLTVPAKAIASTSNKLQLPSKTECYEELYFVRITDDGEYEISEWNN